MNVIQHMKESVQERVLRKTELGSSCRGSTDMNLTTVHEDAGSIPSLAQWVQDVAVQLWCRLQVRLRSRLAAAVAQAGQLQLQFNP